MVCGAGKTHRLEGLTQLSVLRTGMEFCNFRGRSALPTAAQVFEDMRAAYRALRP